MKVEKSCAMNFTDNAPPTKNIEPQVPFKSQRKRSRQPTVCLAKPIAISHN